MEKIVINKSELIEVYKVLEMIRSNLAKIGSSYGELESEDENILIESMALRLFMYKTKMYHSVTNAQFSLNKYFSEEVKSDGLDELERICETIEDIKHPHNLSVEEMILEIKKSI